MSEDPFTPVENEDESADAAEEMPQDPALKAVYDQGIDPAEGWKGQHTGN